MSGELHTPGPWLYDGDYVWADAIEGYVANPQTEDMRSGDSVPLRKSQAVIDANGRLIAASPDLLAACVAALNFIDGDASCAPVLRAAIGKAMGSTP